MTEQHLVYILGEDKTPIPTDWNTATKWFEDISSRRVAEDEINGFRISTVFLVINHNHGGGDRPVLFETMVFTDDKKFKDEICERYCTWNEAIVGHEKVVNQIRKYLDREVPTVRMLRE